MNRQRLRSIFEGVMRDLSQTDIVAVDVNSTGVEVEFAVWVRAEDAERFLKHLSTSGTHVKATIDLYGPPRYARTTTTGGDA